MKFPEIQVALGFIVRLAVSDIGYMVVEFPGNFFRPFPSVIFPAACIEVHFMFPFHHFHLRCLILCNFGENAYATI